MRLQRYSFASFLLILLIGSLVYTQTSDVYTFVVMSIPISLPIAIWMVLPVIFLYGASIAHMMYYSYANSKDRKRLKNDLKKLSKSIAQSLLLEPKPFKYKREDIADVAMVLDGSEMRLKNLDIAPKDEELQKIIETIGKIESGESVDLSKYKLSKENIYFEKNVINKIHEDNDFIEFVLRNKSNYTPYATHIAFSKFITYADFKSIEKLSELIRRDDLFVIIDRFCNKDECIMNLSAKDFMNLKSKLSLSPKDYILISKKFKKVLSPDGLIEFFADLKELDESAEEAYVYTLLDFEMVDRAKEYLEQSAPNELLKFKAYLALKDSGKNYSLELFA